MLKAIAMVAVASWGAFGAAAARAYEAPDMEKLNTEDLAKFKEAYTFYMEGLDFEREGSWVSASQAYRNAVKIYPNYPDAQYGVGKMALRLGRLDEAEEALVWALRLKPELYQAHSELGSVHYRRGEYNKAALEFKEALKHDAEDAVALYNLANAYRNLGKPKDAVAAFEKTLALDAGNIDCYYNMALAYEDMAKPEEAVAAFENFIEGAGDDPDQAEWVTRAREYIKEIREGEKGK